MAGRRASCAWEMKCAPEILTCLKVANETGYDFIVTPIVHPRFRREFVSGKAKNREGSFARADLVLGSQDWSTLVVGMISPWINVDSNLHNVRRNSEMALEQELSYCYHLSLPAILVALRSINCTNLARIIYNKVLGLGNVLIWVEVPMVAPVEEWNLEKCNGTMEDEAILIEKEDTWKWWNRFHTLCNWERKIGLALVVTANLPEPPEMQRWLAEPIRCAIVHTNLFLTNKKGFPVLTRPHQKFVQKLLSMDCQIIIRGHNRHQHMKLYQQYIDHLAKIRPPDDELRSFARGYEDYLQCPLQPLMDNLESQTYETFERDPVKYRQYQAAIGEALRDLKKKTTEDIVVMVVGAGRGPLVECTITVSKTVGAKVRVYAVEKNPNAAVTLHSRKMENWGEVVTIVESDMRDWNAPEKADILISELLGSFGDNELSPECLDGAQKFLKDDGISIPCSYTSWIAPLQSSRLYNEVRNARDKEKSTYHNFETAYVVHFQNKMLLNEPQPLFTFHHPNRDEPIDNSRFGMLRFDVGIDCVIHGIGGYFDAVLYKDITLSIVPATHSKDMFSWFPILFPIKNPVPVTAGSTVEVCFWRRLNNRIVWYEWCLTSPQHTPIHNPKGRSYSIGL